SELADYPEFLLYPLGGGLVAGAITPATAVGGKLAQQLEVTLFCARKTLSVDSLVSLPLPVFRVEQHDCVADNLRVGFVACFQEARRVKKLIAGGTSELVELPEDYILLDGLE